MSLSLFAYDSHETFPLTTGWTLSRVNNPENDPTWTEIPTEVPGCVHLDLMRAGLIPDPFVGMNEKEVAWVAEEDWRYTCDFDLGEDWSKRDSANVRQLVFEGLDTFADIILDGELIGEGDNAFIPHRFPLPDTLKPGLHRVEVLLRSPVQTIEALSRERGHAPAWDGGPRSWARKPQYSFGWDWGPILPTSGMHRPVYLQRWYDGRIGWYRYECEPAEEAWTVRVQATVQAPHTGEYRLLGSLQRNDNKVVDQTTFYAEAGANTVSLTFTVPDPDLWWPATEGESALYGLELELIRNRRSVHTIREHIGLRTVEWVEEPDKWGKSFYVRINGRDIFCKGANWVPGDSFTSRVTEQQVRRHFQLAIDAGMNMLRIWGGGQYEPAWYYRTADEMGLMIWQDFPYACSLYPDDLTFTHNGDLEARTAVQQLARHASIVIWCGNNEIQRDEVMLATQDSIKVLERDYWDVRIRQALADNDPSAFYIQSSPTGGSFANDPREGDRHVWEVWNGWGATKDYLDQEARFISEFGFHGFPHPETLRDVLHPGKVTIQDETLEWHNKQVDGPERHHRYQAAMYPVTTDYNCFLRQSQDLQGRTLRMAIEHWRRHMPRTMGTLIWQLNDCWPVISWSLYDYRFRPKASWYQVRRAFSPRTAFITGKDKPVLWTVNDTATDWEANLVVYCYGLNGVKIQEKVVQLDVPQGRAVPITDIDVANWLKESENCFLAVDVLNGSKYCPLSTWLPYPFKHLPLEQSEIELKPAIWDDQEGWLVRAVDKPAFGVWLYDPDQPDLMLSDNAFDLMPGYERFVVGMNCSTGKPMPIRKLEVWSL